MADQEAYLHNRDLFRDDGEMQAYHCPFHKGWHLGHSKESSDNPVRRVHELLDELGEE
jgi:hypothetical protein